MKTYKVVWTDRNGHRQASVVSYDHPGAQERKQELEADGMSDVTIVPVFPPDWGVEINKPRTGRIVQRKHTARSTS